MGFSTTIKRKYWKMKMEDEKEDGYFIEWKENKEFWNKRIENICTPCNGTFLVGSEVHRVRVVQLFPYCERYAVPLKYRQYLKSERVHGIMCELIK